MWPTIINARFGGAITVAVAVVAVSERSVVVSLSISAVQAASVGSTYHVVAPVYDHGSIERSVADS